MLNLQGYDERSELPISTRYGVGATISKGMKSGYYGVSGLHSGEAGMIIEKLDESYPGIIAEMTAVADGRVTLETALARLKTKIPEDLYELLQKPNYDAWQELVKRLGLAE